jgi:AraC-like DNA-binding protein
MPPSLAAGVIALLIRRISPTEYPDTVSYERIASVCGVSEGTLQKCLKKLEVAVAAGQIDTLK